MPVLHRSMRNKLAALPGVLLFAAPFAVAQDSALERMVMMYSPPDEYYFFEQDRKKVIDYKSENVVRICAGDSRHAVPLRVTYDGERATIGSGDCMRVEAKEIFLEPDEPLDPNWVIVADVQTVS